MSRDPFSFFGSSIFRTIVVVCILLLTACGWNRTADNRPGNDSSSGTLTFTVEWEFPPASLSSAKVNESPVHPMAPVINVCSDYGIANMTMQVLSGQTVLVETSVPCENHGATLNNVPAGSNLTLHLIGSVQGAGNVWNGYSSPFNLAASDTKDVGKVTMTYTGNDTTPPTILSVSPADNATHVLNNSTIRVQFSEKMAVNTVLDNSAIVVTDNVSGRVNGTITYNPADNSASFQPSSPLASGARFSVSVPNVATDMAGNKLASAKVWNFIAHVPGSFLDPIIINSSDLPSGDTPHVGMDGNGNAIVVWMQSDGSTNSDGSKNYNITSNMFSASNQTWSGPFLLENSNGTAEIPAIAVDRNGNAIVAWHQFDGTRYNIWANRYSANTQSWTGAIPLETNEGGNAYPPKIAIDGNGNAIVVWQLIEGASWNIYANRYSSLNKTWSGPFLLENNSGTAEVPDIAMNENGNAIVVWQHTMLGDTRFHIWANRYSSATQAWSGAIQLENNQAGSAQNAHGAMDKYGNATTVWMQSDGTRDNIWANRFSVTTNTWSVPFLLENDNGTAKFPQIAMDENGNAITVWMQSDGTRDNIWANRFSVTTNTWMGAFLLESNDGGTDIPQISMDGNGNAIAAWSQFDGSRYSIWANRYTVATNTWMGAFLLETSDVGNAFSPQISMDRSGSVIIVWFQYDGTTWNIWAIRTY